MFPSELVTQVQEQVIRSETAHTNWYIGIHKLGNLQFRCVSFKPFLTVNYLKTASQIRDYVVPRAGHLEF